MPKLTSGNTFIFLALLVMAGCNTFFEENITNEIITLLSPTPGIKTDIASQTFWWEKLDGATSYRLQIVSPAFDSTEIVLLDTLISTNKFTYILYPSVFEWRVRGENNGYLTSWANGKVQIYSTTDLSRQKVNILSPSLITNFKSITFKWDKLYNAKNYYFVIYNDQWEGIPAVTPIQVDSTYFEKILRDGNYIWGVKAKNLTSETLYTQKNLIVDSTAPTKAVLSSPADSSVTSGTTILFKWNSLDLTSGIAQDTLKVFSDKNLTNLVKFVASDTKGAEISFTNRTAYYWTVRSVDKAGNVSQTSNTFSFTIN